MSQTRQVATAIAEKDFAKAMSLRDPEFAETLEGFFATSVLEKEPKLPHHLVSPFYFHLTYSRLKRDGRWFLEDACWYYAVSGPTHDSSSGISIMSR